MYLFIRKKIVDFFPKSGVPPKLKMTLLSICNSNSLLKKLFFRLDIEDFFDKFANHNIHVSLINLYGKKDLTSFDLCEDLCLSLGISRDMYPFFTRVLII